jgi:hypothetical protein
MSETIGNDIGHHVGHHVGHHQSVREAYAFVCISCGHGWERAYDIEHHTDARNLPYVTYICDGKRVPSPLTRPACENCEGHKVRIMRSGQVSDVAALWETELGRRASSPRPRSRSRARRWSWSRLHLLHRRRAS